MPTAGLRTTAVVLFGLAAGGEAAGGGASASVQEC